MASYSNSSTCANSKEALGKKVSEIQNKLEIVETENRAGTISPQETQEVRLHCRYLLLPACGWSMCTSRFYGRVSF